MSGAGRERVTREAVEAAAMAIYAVNGYGESGYELDDYRKDAQAALEAAAPHLMAAAWDECMGSMVYEDGTKVEILHNANPYREARR